MSLSKIICSVDAKTLHVASRLDEISKKVDLKCAEAATFNGAMPTVPLTEFQYGTVPIFFAGPTNVGKSSLVNGIICDNSAAPFCSTNIKAETVHCTTFRAGPSFIVGDGRSVEKRHFFDKLKSLQKRVVGSDIESSKVGEIEVTMPHWPFFDPQGLALVVDTPGATEDPAMGEAVLKRLKSCQPGDLPVLVYCYSLASGLSTRPGMELSTQDKMFIEAAEVPPHRMIIVATQYDQFVSEQKDENNVVEVNGDEDWNFADFDLMSPEEKMLQANQSFELWADKIKARFPGITVLPSARIGPMHGLPGDPTPAQLRKEMLQRIRQALAEKVHAAHGDMLIRYHSYIQATLSNRLTDAIEGSRQQASQFDPAVVEAMRESQVSLEFLLPNVSDIIRTAHNDLVQSNGKYLREKSFHNDLLDRVHDSIMALIRRSFGVAQSQAYLKLTDVLRASTPASMSSRDPSLGPESSRALDWFDGALVLCPAGGAVVGGLVLLCEGAFWARGLIALGAGSAVGLVLFASTTLVATAAWTYEGVVDKIYSVYESAIKQKMSTFTAELESRLRQEVLDTINRFNRDVGEGTATALEPVQAMLNDKDLNKDLNRHLVGMCCICYENPCDTLLQPCGHAGFCHSCVAEPNLEACPLCRQPIEERWSSFIQ